MFGNQALLPVTMFRNHARLPVTKICYQARLPVATGYHHRLPNSVTWLPLLRKDSCDPIRQPPKISVLLIIESHLVLNSRGLY